MMLTDAGHVCRALTIAGSDSGGGAGIQADLKTFAAFGVYGTSAVTALTAQNTVGVQGVQYVPAEFVGQQIDAVLSDIGVDAAKTGMLGSADIMVQVGHRLRNGSLKNLVVDPVMIAKGGQSLMDGGAIDTLKSHLLPLAAVVTPNLPEAEVLCGYAIDSWEACHDAARHLIELGCGFVIIKGGHAQEHWREHADPPGIRLAESAIDLVYDGEHFTYFITPRVTGGKTHGTGCTFSAAITASLALGRRPIEAIAEGKSFVYRAIASAQQWDVGQGHGPTDHSVKPVTSMGIEVGRAYVWNADQWDEFTWGETSR